MSLPVFPKPSPPTLADTDQGNLREIANILVDKISKLAKARPRPQNLLDQLQQWNQRVVLLYEATSSGKAKKDIKAVVKNEIDKKAGALRKAAQDAQAGAGHTHRIEDHPAGDPYPARKARATNDVTTLTAEAKNKPAADQPAYQQALRHLKQEIDAYDGYSTWDALP